MTNQEIARRAIAAAEALDGIADPCVHVELGTQHALAADLFSRIPTGVGYSLGGDSECHAFTAIKVPVGTIEICLFGPPDVACPFGRVHDRATVLAALRDIAAGVPAPQPATREELVSAARAGLDRDREAFAPTPAMLARHQPHPAIPVDDEAA